MPFRRWLLFGICIVLIFVLGAREWTLLPDGKLHIHFLSVGQGDSALITTPSGKRIVIDGGPDWSTLEALGQFLPFFHRHIDLLVLSHPNLDHIVSLPEIIQRYTVDAVAYSGVENSLGRYHELRALAKASGTKLVIVSAGQSIDEGDGVSLDVLWPPRVMPKGFTKNVNDTSVVIKLRYGEHSALFTGDMERPSEETLLRSNVDLHADVLKIAHHGSRTSTTEGFLRAVSPALAVISVGVNSFGHPREEVLERLRRFGVEMKRTDKDGVIELIW